MRRNRIPGYDLQHHIVTGSIGPASGQPGLVQDLDSSDIDSSDPMEFGAADGRFEGRSIGEITMSNLAGSMSLDSAATFGTEMGMNEANDNSDPGKGDIPYGRRNIGGK